MQSYKYLGIQQIWVNSGDNAVVTFRKVRRAIANVMHKGIVLGNLSTIIRVYIKPLVRFVLQTTHIKGKMLERMNKAIRWHIKQSGILPMKMDNGRLYASVRDGGFKIPDLKVTAILETIGMLNYFTTQQDNPAVQLQAHASDQRGTSDLFLRTLRERYEALVPLQLQEQLSAASLSLSEKKAIVKRYFQLDYQEGMRCRRLKGGFAKASEQNDFRGTLSMAWLHKTGLTVKEQNRILLLQEARASSGVWNKVIGRSLDQHLLPMP